MMLSPLHYHRTLLTFRQYGRSIQANEVLDAALEQNEHVAVYVLGLGDMLLDDVLVMHGWGDEYERILYAASSMVLWAQTSGAQH